MLRLLPIALLLLLGCQSETEPDEATTTFDRATLLRHWADDLIVPAFEDFSAAAAAQSAAATDYATEPTEASLGRLQEQFEEAYLAWQRVSPYMTGPGESVRLREQVNTYPTDTQRLTARQEIVYELPANTDVQGMPALDFLLFGVEDPALHRARIAEIAGRISTLSGQALSGWQDGYRDDYVASAGSSATASVDRTVNDFLYWYERNLRAGKVGIPAGVFSSEPRPELAEAIYHGALSKRLFLEALAAGRAFYRSEPGLADYLDALRVERDGQLLSERIDAGFVSADAIATDLNADFATQVRLVNTPMLRLYDALQANVILLKVDLLQALSINVDYVDADGD
ncbi:imelysin family protein [Lewinella sp. IMCC34183]|uniref:imelysin family protein n=1 Tax=Lewinella sp. IMCC34183 TaxID=2248762 RepID=UPI000E26F2CC|nr:imelysin family protein [Lewinella sp. IMCC34183]